MTTVALIGPDGAGKTTVARGLPPLLPVPVRYLYMGVSTDSSNVMLPTTRLARRIKRARGAAPDTAGPPSHGPRRPRSRSFVRRRVADLRAALRVGNRFAEEWYRQWLAWRWTRSGAIVLFDRHFFVDYHAYDVDQASGDRSWSQRLHGLVLGRLYPRPDLVIYLDAPGEVLLARKGEGTVEALERRRDEYRAIAAHVGDFVEVDATQPVAAVTDRVAEIIVSRLPGHARAASAER
jgi:thymidylate kinase